MYPHQSFVFTTFSPTSFWAQRRDVVRKNTLRFQLKMMKETGRYDAFKLEWKPIYDEPPTAVCVLGFGPFRTQKGPD